MKRYTMIGATVTLALFSSAALAAPNVVNTTQKGSLLIFPEIDVEAGTNTIIRITNDHTKDIDVKCYYGEYTGDPNYKPTRDFMFRATGNQPVYWEAKDGRGTIAAPDFPQNGDKDAGQLICWAVSRGGATQVKWNHLSGTATVVDTSSATAFSYNAYQFFARGAKNKKQVGGAPGTLDLDGTAADGGYDKCGQYIIGHFSPLGAAIYLPDDYITIEENTLSVSSCTQDLSPVGKATPIIHDIVFDVWNEYEQKFTGAREKADSWWRMILGGYDDEFSTIDYAKENFTYDQLQTDSAYFRAESEKGYGLVGVLVTELGYWNKQLEMKAAVTVNHAGNRAGMIKWRTQDGDPPEKM